MDSERPNLLVPAANASLVPVVVMSGVGFVVDLLLKVTVAGLALACLFSLVATAAYCAIAAWVTPRLYSLHVGEPKGGPALSIAFGVALALTLGYLIGSVASDLLGMAAGRSGPSALYGGVSGVTLLVVDLFSNLFGGLTIGLALSFLGSFVALGRTRQSMERAF